MTVAHTAQLPRRGSRKAHRRLNPARFAWLRLRHSERAFSFLSRAGRFGLAENEHDLAHCYRDWLGLPCQKGHEP